MIRSCECAGERHTHCAHAYRDASLFILHNLVDNDETRLPFYSSLLSLRFPLSLSVSVCPFHKCHSCSSADHLNKVDGIKVHQ